MLLSSISRMFVRSRYQEFLEAIGLRRLPVCLHDRDKALVIPLSLSSSALFSD